MKTCPQCGTSYEAAQKFCARDGQVLEDSPQDLVGRVLDGQYEIEAFVASGGMGTVYRARHILLGDRVAIKVLLPQFRANPEWLRRFQREGQAARRFNHPNAVAVYDLRTSSDGLVYMVMEFVEGRTLDEELRACGRFTPAQALEMLEPVGRVLEAAHLQGVVHRDLKPANVMVKRLDAGGVWIELLDLGIAKLSDFSDGGSPLTIAGQVLGTPYYMSPEQWGERQRDGNPEIDGRADIYSLGLMFYELVSGARPTTAKSLPELRLFHAATMPPRLDAVAPDVPEAFARAVERATAKDRADRYAHAADFVDELRAALDLPPARTTSALTGATGALSPQASATAPASSPTRGGLNEQAAPDADNVSEETLVATRVRAPDPNAKTALFDDAPSSTHATRARQPDAARSASPAPEPDAPPPSAWQTNASSPSVAPSNVIQPNVSQPNGGSSAPVVQSSVAQSSVVEPSVSQSPVVQPSDAPARAAPLTEARRGGAKKSRAPLVALVVVLLLFVCAIMAGTGWFLWSRWQQARSSMIGAPPATSDPNAKPTGARVEALSYWIEAFDNEGQSEGKRVADAGAITLASGEQFKFHFSPDARGYLYVVGPGERNAPTTFLTAEPATGLLKTNLAAANADFAFPYGAGQVLQLDKNPGTEEYTVIFSESPLLEPKFLAARGGHALTPAELKQLEDLRARAQTAAPAENVKESDGARSVSVTVLQGAGANGVVVFDVRIEHR